MSTPRRPAHAPAAPGHFPAEPDHEPDPLRSAGSPTRAGHDHAESVTYAGLSATVAGFDGTVLATVFRHDEYTPSGDALAVVSVTGDLDRDSVPLLLNTLTAAIDGNPRVCCDLGQVEFFGAAGANTILAAHWHAVSAGRHFTVRGVHGIVRQVFDATGLSPVLIAHA